MMFIAIWEMPIHKWSFYAEIPQQTEASTIFCIVFLAWLAFLLIANVLTAITNRKNVFTTLSCFSWLGLLMTSTFNTHHADPATFTFMKNLSGYMLIFGTTVLSVFILFDERLKKWL